MMGYFFSFSLNYNSNYYFIYVQGVPIEMALSYLITIFMGKFFLYMFAKD